MFPDPVCIVCLSTGINVICHNTGVTRIRPRNRFYLIILYYPECNANKYFYFVLRTTWMCNKWIEKSTGIVHFEISENRKTSVSCSTVLSFIRILTWAGLEPANLLYHFNVTTTYLLSSFPQYISVSWYVQDKAWSMDSPLTSRLPARHLGNGLWLRYIMMLSSDRNLCSEHQHS